MIGWLLGLIAVFIALWLVGLLIPLLIFLISIGGMILMYRAGMLDLEKYPWVVIIPFIVLIAFYFITKIPIMIVELP